MIFSDRAADCTSEVILFLIVLLTTKGVYENTCGVKHGVFVVFKKRTMKVIGA